MHVDIRNGVAEGVGSISVGAFGACAGCEFFVSVACALLQVGEDFVESLHLHATDGAWRESESTAAIFVKHAVFEKLIEQVLRGSVLTVLHGVFDGAHGLITVLEDELHELIEAEEFVGRGEIVPVELAVGVPHTGSIRGSSGA